MLQTVRTTSPASDQYRLTAIVCRMISATLRRHADTFSMLFGRGPSEGIHISVDVSKTLWLPKVKTNGFPSFRIHGPDLHINLCLF